MLQKDKAVRWLNQMGVALLIILIMLDVIMIISHQTNQDMPANVMGYVPYVITEEDTTIGIKEGSVLIAKIPTHKAKVGDIISYVDGSHIRIGKVKTSEQKWYQIENDHGTQFISEYQVIGIKTCTIAWIGYLLLWMTTDLARGLMVLIALIIVTKPQWYYRIEEHSLIYKKLHKLINRKKKGGC